MAKIKDLPKHKRPREKLSAKGAENLSDAELLAILIRTGRAGKSALDIAKETLKNTLYQNYWQ
jgi:DNA repair protein RadC